MVVFDRNLSNDQLKKEIYDVLITHNIVTKEEINYLSISINVADVVFGYKNELNIIVRVLCNEIKLEF